LTKERVQQPALSAKSGFHHQAFFYAGETDFLAGVVPFISRGVANGESVMVAVPADRIRLLREALGETSADIQFIDMGELGRNPGRVISVWSAFLANPPAAAGGWRGVGEPITAGLNAARLVEAQIHEHLLNHAFDEGVGWELLCSYDSQALDHACIEEAGRSHPLINHAGTSWSGPDFQLAELGALLEDPLPQPPGDASEFFFAPPLRMLREWISQRLVEMGMAASQSNDLVLAVSEVASNSVLHGGGHGSLLTWREEQEVVCEIRDSGRLTNALVGRVPPDPDQGRGRGLWLTNWLCDLVQLRSYSTGTVVRLYKSLTGFAL
jgi:anti-sigma regulatory factor (Ser/Thr protein kinase)